MEDAVEVERLVDELEGAGVNVDDVVEVCLRLLAPA